jgi:hypothetical protein
MARYGDSFSFFTFMNYPRQLLHVSLENESQQIKLISECECC